MIDNKTVGQAIAKLRLSKNMTQQSLAACLNVSHQAVSKWEKGAALPDVLTLVELSRMFGVTLEQLLAGDVDFRVDGNAEKPEKPIELKLDYEDIRRKAEKAADDAADIAGESEADPGESAEDAADEKAEDINLDRIIDMAPFMSHAALEEMVLKYSGKCTPKQLAMLAPFMSKDCLEKLVVNCESEISWDTLRRLAPFLRKEAVDALAAAAAKSEKYTNDIGQQIKHGIKKVYNFGDQIYHDTIKPAIKKVIVNEHKKAPKQDETTPVNRVTAARARIFERALNEERFDWIGEHIDQLDDATLRSRIVARALELGKNDWVEEYMSDYCDQDSIDNAILSGNWDYVAAHLENAGDDALVIIADTAAAEGRWDWISANLGPIAGNDDARDAVLSYALKACKFTWIGSHIEVLELNGEQADAVAAQAMEKGEWAWLEANAEFLDGSWANAATALRAYQAGHKALAVTIVVEHISDSDLNELIESAVVAGDMEFAQLLAENNGGDTGAVCINLARAGYLKAAAELAENLEPDAIAVLLDIASEQGNWEIIDTLNDMLD